MRAGLRRLWPRTLAAQLIVLTATAVLLSNLGIAVWFTATHERLTESTIMERVLDRATSAATVLSGIPHREREAAARTMSSGPWHFHLKLGKAVQQPMDAREAALATRARAMLPAKRQKEPVSVRLLGPRHASETRAALGTPPARCGGSCGDHLARRARDRTRNDGLPPATGTVAAAIRSWPHFVAVLTASAAAAFAARRVARPLSKLADAATELARGGEAPRVPEEGPDDVRRAAEAFNAMTDQVKRTLESQRQLLSAVGHDLRTPITAMRISTEFIADTEVKERIEKNLEELQSLTEAVLGAARNAGWEKRRRIDLAALIESVGADLEEMGKPVAWEPHPAVPVACRPNEIRRAVRNLIENAITYGKSAQVHLTEEAGMVAITVEDEGPGIAEVDRARVFEPFFRLESSRSAETGGAGLGLTLVKAIAEGHGGSMTWKIATTEDCRRRCVCRARPTPG